MSAWLPVNTEEVNKEKDAKINGVNVRVCASPYDVPMKVRGYKDQKSDYFVIDLEYPLTGEKTNLLNPSKEFPVELEVGVKSGRIYTIRVDVVKLKAERVGLEFVADAPAVEMGIHKAIEALSSHSTDRLKNRYEVTGSVLNASRDLLLSAVRNG